MISPKRAVYSTSVTGVSGVFYDTQLKNYVIMWPTKVSMNKQETYQYLTNHGIRYEVTEHQAVYNMKELDSVDFLYPECVAKNLFCVDDKKRNYYLITIKGDKRIELKEFRKQHGLRNLSFASEDDLMSIMGLLPGSVTPLGLLQDAECRVHFYLDKEFLGNRIGVHPNDNTATVWMEANDLIQLIKAHGNEVTMVELENVILR